MAALVAAAPLDTDPEVAVRGVSGFVAEAHYNNTAGCIIMSTSDDDQLPVAAPNDYGLVEGDEVRFPRPGKVRPDTGVIVGMNADGSFRVKNDRTKMERALNPADLERKLIGPRGGVSWEPVVK